MKTWAWILSGCVLAAGSSALTTLFLAPANGGRQAARDDEELAGLERTLGELSDLARGIEARERELAAELAALAERPAAPASTRTEVGGLDAAVARWMEANAEDLGAGLAQEALRSPSPEPQDTDEVLAFLLREGGGLGEIEEQELWDRLRKEGKIDDVVEAIEELAAERPNDPDLSVELGNAYIQKIFDVGMGPMAGVFGQKADEAFDRALELDPEHWEARFTKAVSLSNWPAFLGKTGEAIQHFETLIGQQESRSPQTNYAQTYYFLGNMYLQTGETEKALAAWKRGIAIFPDDTKLLGQISTYSAQGGSR